MNQVRNDLVAMVAALVLTLAVAYWLVTGDQTRTTGRHLAVYFTAFVAYTLAARALESAGPWRVRAALLIAVSWRGALVFSSPLLSDDVYRLVWEGRIQNLGGNPYAWQDRPEAEEWAWVRDSTWNGVNHKGYTAIYPPAWQLAARAVTRFSQSVVAMKAFLVACELGALAFVAASVARRGLAPGRLVLWAWNPLALVEIAGSGHNEAFGLLWLAAALAALDANRAWASALASAVGFQAKFLPGLVALAWARRYRPAQILGALALTALLAWPYREAGRDMTRSLQRYAREWRFNDSGFDLLVRFVPEAQQATLLAGLLLVLFALALAWRRVEPARSQFLLVGAVLVLSPNVLPWYAAWLLPSLVLLRSAPALLFTLTVALAYTVYPGWLAGGPWCVGAAIRVLEYAPPLLLGVFWRRAS